jgi:hypothetical protein
MIRRTQVPSRRQAQRLRVAIAFAITACTTQTVVLAQTSPYESGKRASFGRGVGQEELPPGLTFEPRLDGAIQYADSSQSSGSGSESSAGIELAPGAYAAYNSSHFLGAVDYSLIGRLWDDGDLDDITHALAANGRWNAIPELFSVSGNASYGDVLIDQQQGGNNGNIGVFNSGNIAEQATASLRPSIRKRFKDFQASAEYVYGRVWYLDQGKGQPSSPLAAFGREDAENQSANVSLGLIPDGGRYTAKVFYTWDHSEFETSLPYEFERAGFEGSLELFRSVALVGDVGKESALDESTTSGGLDSDFWSAGLAWQNSNRSKLEARYGERFFGSSYLFKISHRARLLEFNASYSESPDVETRRVNLDSFEPGELPPWYVPGIDLGVFTSQPYVGKNVAATIRARGNFTTVGVRGYDTRREYLNDVFGDEHTTGVALFANRKLAVNASIDARLSYNDRQRDDSQDLLGQFVPASHTYETDFNLSLNRDFGPQFVVSVETGYFNNSGTTDSDGWWVGLRGRWYPAFGQ